VQPVSPNSEILANPQNKENFSGKGVVLGREIVKLD